MKKNNKGFTLIEYGRVAIIGICSSGVVAYSGYTSGS